jgi:hypothetical protein
MEATYERTDLSDRLDRRDHGDPFVLGPALIGQGKEQSRDVS